MSTAHLTSLLCDADPADEPTWMNHVVSTARIDATTRVTAENTVEHYSGARLLRIVVTAEQGGMLVLELSNAGMVNLTNAIAAADAARRA